ncbi:MAG: response regulator [Magnetococcales bacterium]|nr:response regulator [Magnetococcales bacterium]
MVDLRDKLRKLNQIGVALSSSVDLDLLLEMILVYAKELTRADAGTLYLVVDKRFLGFEIVRTDSLGISLGGASGRPCSFPLIPLYLDDDSPDLRSIVSACVLERKIIRIEDAYAVTDYDFEKTREFDRSNGYRSRSFLTAPLMIDGEEPVGAIQLINATDEKSGQVEPFSEDDESLVESLASQATIALNHHRLNDHIQKQLIYQKGIVEIHRVATSPLPWKQRLESILDTMVAVHDLANFVSAGIFIVPLQERSGEGECLRVAIGMDGDGIDRCCQLLSGLEDLEGYAWPCGHFVLPVELEERRFGMISIVFDHRPALSVESIDFLKTAGRIMAGVLDCEHSKALIAESERYLETILDHALDGIMGIDARGRIVYSNTAAMKIFGYLSSEWDEIAIGDLIPNREFLSLLYTSPLGVGEEQFFDQPGIIQRRINCTCLGATGKSIDLDIGLVVCVWHKKINNIVFLHDITSEKQLLRSLKDTLSVAEAASKTKSAFLANMSHEIRSPMNAIIGMTDLILTNNLPREEELGHLQMVLNAGLSLLDLINDILDISKIEAGKLVFENIPFDLCGRIEDVCETMAVKAHQKSLDLYCDVAWDLPETLEGDPLRLKQILINLINNAIKFTTSGFVLVRVEGARMFDAEGDGFLLHIDVADTGIGIPEDKLNIIFKEFTQVDDSTSRKYGGTGLGLGISKHLVQMMNGQIWVESVLGQGSTFHFTVRLSLSSQPHTRGCRSEHEDRGSAPRQTNPTLAGVRVLIAGGPEIGQSIIGKAVVGFGGACRTVADGVALLAALQEARNRNQPFDVLLVDECLLREELPETGLLEARSGCRSAPIVLLPTNMSLSAVAGSGWLQDALSLKKPVRRFQLLNRIQQVLGKESGLVHPLDRSIKRRTDVHPLHILLVEDLATNQRLATTILHQAGHLVTLANHGGEALEVLKRKQPLFDLILMDLQMPHMDGFETTLRIRESHPSEVVNPRIPIIAVTACIMASEEEKCRAIGMNGYLRKPYRPHELIQVVEPFLRLRQRPVTRIVLEPVDGDQESWNRARSVFQEEVWSVVKALRRAMEKKNITQAVQVVGRLGLLAQGIGAGRIGTQTIRIKGSVEVGDWEEVGVFVEKLDEQITQTLELLTGL